MTTNSLAPVVDYLEDGATRTHPVPFKFLDRRDLKVFRIANGVAIQLALGPDYSVAGAGNPAGGSITKALGGTAGAVLRIRRFTPRLQTLAYRANDTFPAASHEAALDRQMLIAQEQEVRVDDLSDRALLLPVGADSGDLVPLAAEQGIVTITPTGHVAVLPSSALVGGSIGNFDGGFDGLPDGNIFDGGIDG